MPKISIIIPAHNNEGTLNRSLDSVLSQTFADFEAIVVDDASTDRTYEIAKEISCLDDRVSCIHLEENVHGALARKCGVQKALGEYIMFLDADDELEQDAFEILHREMSVKPVDVLHFGVTVKPARMHEAQVADSTERFLAPCKEILCGQEVYEACFTERKYNWNLVNKMFSASVCRKGFEHVRAIGVHRGDDLYSYAGIAYYAQSYRGLSNRNLYIYNFGDGQDGSSIVDFERYKELSDSYKAVEEVRAFLDERNAPDLYYKGLDGIERALMDNCANQCRHMLSHKDTARAFDLSCSKWGGWQAVASFARAYWEDQGSFPSMISESSLFAAQPVKAKRIAAYYHAYYGGGAEGVMRSLAKKWVSMGYSVILLVDKETEHDAENYIEGVDVIKIPSIFELDPAHYFMRAEALYRILLEREIDTIVYHGWLNHSLLWDMLVAKLLEIRFVVHCHGVFSHCVNFLDTRFAEMPKVYGLADAIVTLNAPDSMFWGAYNKNVFQTENPISMVVKDGHAPSLSMEKVVLWMGRISPEKHPEEALFTFFHVHNEDPEARFILAGAAANEQYGAKIRALSDDLGLTGFVEFPGWLDGEEKASCFRRARVFLMTSEAREGYPLTLVESKVFGLPCIMYELPYLSLVDGDCGVVSVPFGRAEVAAREVAAVLCDDDRAKAMSEKAKQSLARIANFDFVDLWDKVFSTSRGEPATDGGNLRLMLDTLLEAYTRGTHEKLAALRKSNDYLRKRNKTLEEKNKKFSQSNSWMVGRAITWLPRKIAKLFQ
ncbi:glycosyltransferase [Raoultibacter massiliensis]|uniref:Glycosyltransferase n=1 Tax=Raoultibacter massiliensis TaxID=1852371 RepID=A0ABV1JI08_9ACTN|nr:glycosyltransferase [Raoultibacter massiliensis]